MLTFPSVSRLLAALLLARLLVQSAGIDLLVAWSDAPCDESSAGDCSPDCDDCLCCPHQRVLTVQRTSEAPVQKAKRSDFPAAPSPVVDPRAQEIFHIPKGSFSV